MENNTELEAVAAEVLQVNTIDKILSIPDVKIQEKIFYNLHICIMQKVITSQTLEKMQRRIN